MEGPVVEEHMDEKRLQCFSQDLSMFMSSWKGRKTEEEDKNPEEEGVRYLALRDL